DRPTSFADRKAPANDQNRPRQRGNRKEDKRHRSPPPASPDAPEVVQEGCRCTRVWWPALPALPYFLSFLGFFVSFLRAAFPLAIMSSLLLEEIVTQE